MKNSKGITLVALIITIIVLLILALVTIQEVQGNGIIAKAKEASSKHTIAQEKEEIGLAVNEWKVQKNYQNNGETFKSFMGQKLNGIATVAGENNGPLIVTMNKTGNQYTVTDSGEIVTIEKGISISQKELSLTLQGTQKLTVTLTGGLKTEDVVYSTSDKNIATVSEDGTVTAVAIGEATITAKCGQYSATCIVKVREVSLLEQYILGADLKGRDFTEIMDMDNMTFIDEATTIANASTAVTYLNAISIEEDNDKVIIYIGYI